VDFAAAASHAFTRVSSMPAGSPWWGPLAAAKGQVGKGKGQARTLPALPWPWPLLWLPGSRPLTSSTRAPPTVPCLPPPAPGPAVGPSGIPEAPPAARTVGQGLRTKGPTSTLSPSPLQDLLAESAGQGLPLMDTREQTEILDLVSLLTQPSDLGKRTAAGHIRELTKASPGNRRKLAAMGAIPPWCASSRPP